MKSRFPYHISVQIFTCYLIFIFSGCKKFVRTSAPTTQLVSSSVFSNSATATSALLGIYIQMFNNGESWTIAEDQGLLSDELTNYSPMSSQIQLYTNAMLPSSNLGEWNHGYNYIYQANAIIEGLQNNPNIPSAITQQLMGEAKFIRAFWHFYLTNMYSSIPIVTTTDYGVNASLSQSSPAQVYAQIIRDLQDAESLLNANYVDASDTAITIQRVRPTKGAAEALLARVYLFTQRYDSAKIEASNVINNSLYNLCSNLSPLMGSNSVFLANSKEAIWQLSTPLPNNQNTIDALYFILLGAPGSAANNSTTISPQLLNTFESGDKRKINWISSYKTFYFPYKYQALGPSPLSEYTMVLRLGEQYLIRSEAEAQQNDLTDATNDLNVIRNRAGLADISDSIASSKSTLLAAILHERQVELFTEWGHRWFDLNRTGAVDTVMGAPGNVCQIKGGSWNSDWELYPIPQTEITNDANLNQNQGYK